MHLQKVAMQQTYWDRGALEFRQYIVRLKMAGSSHTLICTARVQVLGGVNVKNI